jgi:hypothetical protein
MNEALERLIPQEVIRSETALSRFPIHRLSKKGKVSIEIKTLKPNGELKARWEIKNPPDPLAYKIDTIIVNRRIEEAGKPVPKLLRLGSLNEIAEELGLEKERKEEKEKRKAISRNTERIKKALLQNAFAGIKAKFTYKTTDGTERTIEIADTRYAVIFTGEKLPNDSKADATYILLHDIYREIINSAPTRPLDYDYLKELTPAAQRFYELISYQMFAALKNKTTAKMLYSEFCTYAPQTRFFDWELVRPQMYRIHKLHQASGYIERVAFEQQRSDDGTLDWLMIYIPGQKAKGDHALAMSKPLPRAKRIEKNEHQAPLFSEQLPKLLPEPALAFLPEEETLVSQLKGYGIAEKKARHLVKSRRQAVEEQLAAFPYRTIGEEKKNPAGWLIAAVEYGESGYPPPTLYLEILKQREAKQKTTKRQQEEDTKRARAAAERETMRRAEEKFSTLPESERQKLLAESTAKLLVSPEWANQKPNIVMTLIGSAAKAAIIEEMMRAERGTQ